MKFMNDMLQDADVRIQERVLADAQAVRERHKHARVIRCLQLNRVHHHKVMVEYGKAVILNSIRFLNPSSEAHTFQLKACFSPFSSLTLLHSIEYCLSSTPNSETAAWWDAWF
jgi:hypothetical protein